MTEQNASIVDADAARKDALRKAGQDYFESILAKAAAGKDPFVADAAERRKSRDLESVDPDMETVGLVLKGSKLYFIGTLFFAATTMRLVLAGVSSRAVYILAAHTPERLQTKILCFAPLALFFARQRALQHTSLVRPRSSEGWL